MTFCPNCKQQDCELLKGRNGELWQEVLDLNEWGRQNLKNNLVTFTSYICNVCGNFFAIGKTSRDNKESK